MQLRVGIRALPCDDRQQSPFHTDDNLHWESDETVDTVRQMTPRVWPSTAAAPVGQVGARITPRCEATSVAWSRTNRTLQHDVAPWVGQHSVSMR